MDKAISWINTASERLGVRLSRKSPTEAAGPCPSCGGTDRFIVWQDGGFFCRKCRRSGRWSESAVQRPRANNPDVSDLTKWLSYHQSVLSDPELAGLWLDQGVFMPAVRHYGLGYSKERFPGGSLTIPLWKRGNLLNIKHRLLSPDSYGKYRLHRPGTPACLWNEDVLSSGADVLIVEGEKKAIVLEQFGIANVLGIPGKSALQQLVRAVQEYRYSGRLLLGFDPDVSAEELLSARKLIEDRTAVRTAAVYFPIKPDDAALIYGIDLVRVCIAQAV